MVTLPAFRSEKYKGQALLLILLVMSVVLSLVLSSVSRSVTDVEVSKYEDDAIRAFDAAQAGIEKSVIVGGATSGTKVDLGNSASYTPVIATSSADPSDPNYVKYPMDLASGESAIFFFVQHGIDANGNIKMDCEGGCVKPAFIRFCWGTQGMSSSSNNTPALYLEYFYNSDPDNIDKEKWENMQDLSDIKVAITSADPYSLRRVTNKFLVPDISGGLSCPAQYAFNARITSTVAGYHSVQQGALLFVRATMLYNDKPQPLAVESAAVLPGQGHLVSSTGQSGDVFRKLVLYQGYPEIPFEFTNAIYSKTNLVK